MEYRKKGIDRRTFLKTTSMGGASLFMTSLLSPFEFSGCTKKIETAKRPPNFIIIFTDDQGYADLGVYGARDIETPNVDRMAEEGVKFTDFYVAASVCTPSRAALLTGCYPKRVGLQTGVLFPKDTNGLHPGEITIAESLKNEGYATACVGKWHLGRPSELLPTSQGFDYYYGIPYSNDMTTNHPLLKTSNESWPELPLMRNNEVIEAPVDQTTLTKRYTEESIGFIKNNKDRPFFLYLAHNMPHYPCYSSDDFNGSSERGSYGDSVQEIDAGVGRIMETLKSLGIDDKTLLIFTSDNGPWKEAATINFQGRESDGTTGSALPLSGWKRDTLEGGMRVPAVMRWPGRIPAGSVCRELVSTMDLLPTLAVLAEADIPTDRVIDGKNISKLLKDPTGRTPHDYFYYYSIKSEKLCAVRDAQGYKLHMWRDSEGRNDDPPYEVRELYLLPNDMGEHNNIYEQKPEIVARLREVANDFDRELAENTRPLGEIS